jgi:hypothetical protein
VDERDADDRPEKFREEWEYELPDPRRVSRREHRRRPTSLAVLRLALDYTRHDGRIVWPVALRLASFTCEGRVPNVRDLHDVATDRCQGYRPSWSMARTSILDVVERRPASSYQGRYSRRRAANGRRSRSGTCLAVA